MKRKKQTAPQTDEQIALESVRAKTENFKMKKGLMIQSSCHPIEDAATGKKHVIRTNHIPGLISH